jgi:hypothetical protein
MGGGGGRGPSRNDISRLEELARKTLREGAEATKFNVFISFANEDVNDVNLLRGQAKNENSEIEFNDWSLREPFDSKRAEYIKSGIRDRIERSSVTVVYISEHTANSKWVDWEIRESIRMGKGVIAVHKGESRPRRLPSAITELNVPIIQWTQKGIAAAIEKASGKRGE